ncbi:hypothetical protein MMPV_009037 [Pyropia vietnamensis]
MAVGTASVLARRRSLLARWVAAATLVAMAVAAVAGIGAAEHGSVQELTADTFDTATADGNWLVEFYAPWCGHCNKFAADYAAVAAALAADPPVNVGRVDGSTHRSLSARFSVTGFPSFFYLPPVADVAAAAQDAAPGGPSPMRFTGGRGVDSLVAFARAGGAGGKPVTITPPPSVVEQLLGRKGATAAAAAGRGAPAAHAAVVMEVVREVAERADRWLVAQGGLTPEVRIGILVASAVILAGGGLVALIALVAALGGLVTLLVKSVGGRRTRAPAPAGKTD